MKIFVIGYPSPLGGADTELWHTTRIWRNLLKLDVTFIPTWTPHVEFKPKLDEIGCETYVLEAQENTVLTKVPDLAGSIVVSFCNGNFLNMAPALRSMGCKLVWANCMTFTFDSERKFVSEYGPFEAHMMQSDFQKTMLLSRLEEVGLEEDYCFKIHGAFDVDEWPYEFRPRNSNDPFTVGRLARNDSDKWSSNTYSIYDRIQFPNVRAWVMGIDEKVYNKVGAPPHWVTSLPPNAIEAREFYRKIDTLMPINGGARENWPRVGLEAMAAGVPVIAQRQWGWKEMIVEHETGFLGDSDEELAHWAATMAWNEDLRKEIAENARAYLAEHLASPKVIAEQWEELFNAIL